MLDYILLILGVFILICFLNKGKVGISIMVMLTLWCLFRFALKMSLVESVLLALLAGASATIVNLALWAKRRPRYVITPTFKFMCAAILIFIHLTVAASAFFISISTENVNYLKYMVEGMHFAINAMLTGGFNRNNSEASYAIMGHLKSCRTILPYYSTAFFISVAPLSALGWFISLFDTDVYLHIRLVWYVIIKKPMYVFSDVSERSVLLAKELDKVKKYKIAYLHKPLYCFCRCGKNSVNVQPEMLSEIAYLKGMMLTKSETDYRFTPQKTTYFYCDNNHYSLYKSIENLCEQEWNHTKNDSRDVFLITDDVLNSPMKMIKNNDSQEGDCNAELKNKSVWKSMIDTILKDIHKDDAHTLFVTGKGRMLAMFVNQINKDSDGIDVKVFPTKVEDYIDLTSDIEEKDSTIILSPSSYTHETIETEIASYFGTYNTQDMRGVVILGENPLDNIKLKRRLSDIAESYIKGNKLKVYLYCNDGIAINEETNDSAAIHYYGEDNAVIPNVVTEISDDM